MNKFTPYLPAEFLASFTALARAQNRARAKLMREALREHLDRQGRMLPGWIGRFDSEGDFDSTNVKSWLRKTWKPE